MVEYTQISGEKLTITRDLAWRLADSETLSSCTAVFTPIIAGDTFAIATPTVNATEFSMQVSGGIEGTTYNIVATNTTTKSNVLIDEFSILLR